MPFSKKEELYQLHKQDKYTELYINPENIILPNGVDDYFLDLFRTREEWDSFVEYNTNPETSFHVLEGNMDESVVNIIRGITSMQVINTEESKSRIDGLNKILKHYVKEGYNFYPLLRCMEKRSKDLYAVSDKNEEDNFELKVISDAKRYLSIAEKTVSPYNRFFNFSEQLGKLNEELKTLGRDPEVEDKIADIKAQMKDMCKDFDLNELESVLKNKRALIAEENTIDNKLDLQGSLDENMYNGLYFALGSVSQFKAQQRKLENQGMGE